MSFAAGAPGEQGTGSLCEVPRRMDMPGFEIFYAELEDLAPDDPMRPAALVHVQGQDAKACYDAIGRAYSIYVVGRGRLPAEVGEGYFVVASRPDYPVLREALRPFWPEVPEDPPGRPLGEVPVTRSQELSDVINYVARPPEPDPHVFDEARRRQQNTARDGPRSGCLDVPL